MCQQLEVLEKIREKGKWKQIPFDENYFISVFGDIYSNKKHKLLSVKKGKNGYNAVRLGNKLYTVHRLLAQTFIPNPNNKPQVNHKNGIRTDNRLKNLEWVTASENELHKRRILKVAGTWKNKFSWENPHSKPVIQTKNNFIINIFGSMAEAERQTKISSSKISMACNKKRNSAGGYKWRFYNV